MCAEHVYDKWLSVVERLSSFSVCSIAKAKKLEIRRLLPEAGVWLEKTHNTPLSWGGGGGGGDAGKTICSPTPHDGYKI